MAAQEGPGRNVLIGAAIIVALVASALLIISVDDILRSRRAMFELVGIFPDASGVQAGTPVWLAGSSVGEVLSVTFLRARGEAAGGVALHIELPARLADQVREDSEIRLGAPQLLGAPVVQVDPGSPTAAPIHAGDTLWAAASDSLNPLLARLPAVREQADTLLGAIDRLRVAARGQSERLGVVEQRLEAAALEAGRLEGLLERGPAGRALAEDGLRAEVAGLRARLDTLRTELGELGALTGDSAELALARRSLGAQLGLLRQEQATLDSLLSGPYGTLGRFQADSAVLRAVVETRAALDSLFAELRAAPLRLFF